MCAMPARYNASKPDQYDYELTSTSTSVLRNQDTGWVVVRLLHVISRTDPESGGPIEALLCFSHVLSELGHQIEIVSLESQSDVATRHIPFRITGVGRGTGRYRYNPHLSQWLKENAKKYDCIILHGLWNYSSLGAWRALRNSSTPYVIFAHGMMDPWFRGRYPLKHLAKQIFWSLGEWRVLRDARAVLFTCEEECQRARGVFWGHRYREKVVLFGTAAPNGDPEAEKAIFQRNFPQLNGRRFLLYLSRIHPKKGCDLLIRAMAACLAEMPQDMDLVIAGPDQIGWVSELKELAQGLGIEHRVHWPGMLTGSMKWGAYRNALAFILPSHQENFGIVVAEAMACGTPVLISNKVNIWREIVTMNAGYVEEDTQEGTQKLMLRVLQMRAEQRAEFASAARLCFQTCFDVRTAALHFVDVIAESTGQADTVNHGV